MSLFQRFFFIAALGLLIHTLLTGVLVTNRVREHNAELALRRLDESSRRIYENFNNWKRAIWQELMDLPENPEPREIMSDPATRSLVDMVVRGGSHAEELDAFSVAPGTPAMVRADILRSVPRTMIAVDRTGGRLMLRASRPIVEDHQTGGTVHLIKFLDDVFMQQLGIDAAGSAAFMTSDGAVYAGTLTEGGDALEKALGRGRGYVRVFSLPGPDGRALDASVRKTGYIGAGRREEVLSLVVTVDATWRHERMATIQGSFVAASLVSLGLSAALFLVGAWSLSKPVMRLREALARAGAGDLSVRMPAAANREMSILSEGFNHMAARLEADVRIRERHVREITTLTAANETIFQSIESGMMTVDRELRVRRLNRAACELFGIQEAEALGCRLHETLPATPADQLEQLADVVAAGRPHVDRTVRAEYARVYHLSAFSLQTVGGVEEADPAFCLLIVEDVSERTALEEGMVRAEKLSSLAILTAGVAHEINNPLSSIMTNVQNLAYDLTDSEHVRALDYIEGEARRIRAIVDRLLDFSGNNRARKEYADLKTEIELVVSTVRYATARDSRVRLEFAVADSLPLAGIPGDEMRQIILNLVTNAVQAVGQADGVVLISAWADADGLYLSVQDTGPGIPEDVRARIFDPFFTTKANGSGLGLSVVYGLLRKCGGDCDIRSEPGTGTTFRLVIPIWEEVTHESTAGVPPAHMRGRR